MYQNRNRGYYGIASSLFWLAAAFWIAAARIGGGLGITIVMACVCYIMMTAAVIKGWFNENRKAGIVLTAGIIPVSAEMCLRDSHMAELQSRSLSWSL